MWFKNIQVFECQKKIDYQPEALAQRLMPHVFKPCSTLAPSSIGFAPPIGIGPDAPLVYGTSGFMIMCIRFQEKVLPAAVVREQHQQKVQELEQKLGRPLPRNEKLQIKDELYHTLIAKAFCKSSHTYLYFDTKTNQLIVDASGKGKCERINKLLNKALHDYHIAPYALQSPASILTRWLKEKRYPPALSIMHKCTLEDHQEQKGKVSFSGKDLFSESVRTLLDEGNHVTRLGLCWADKILFTLKEDFSISGVRFLDDIKDLAKDGIQETTEERFAADFSIMSETIQVFLSEVLPEFIEQEEQEAIPA